mgnify:CR=1 FL=1
MSSGYYAELKQIKAGTLVQLSAYGGKLQRYTNIPLNLVGIVIAHPYTDYHRVRFSNGKQCTIERMSLKRVKQ